MTLVFWRGTFPSADGVIFRVVGEWVDGGEPEHMPLLYVERRDEDRMGRECWVLVEDTSDNSDRTEALEYALIDSLGARVSAPPAHLQQLSKEMELRQ